MIGVMKLLFCNDPFNVTQPDEQYVREVEAARKAGLTYSLISFESLVYEEQIEQALRAVPPLESEMLALYRGWMLKPEQYTRFYNALLAKGWRLINPPDKYKHCHYLPDSYAIIESHTPLTTWLKVEGELPILAVYDILRQFESMPILIKDFVKSQKHYWHEACYIPSAADRENAEKVIRRFLELQGDDLNEGLVFREFVELESIGSHPKSQMPRTLEYRIFWLDGQPIGYSPYWDEGTYATPPIEQFQKVAREVQSRFFSMDIAKRKNGDWIIIELGDGQVAGLPEAMDVQNFYQALMSVAEGKNTGG